MWMSLYRKQRNLENSYYNRTFAIETKKKKNTGTKQEKIKRKKAFWCVLMADTLWQKPFFKINLKNYEKLTNITSLHLSITNKKGNKLHHSIQTNGT